MSVLLMQDCVHSAYAIKNIETYLTQEIAEIYDDEHKQQCLTSQITLLGLA